MPTVFSAKLDGSEAVRYFHVSLVVFYLKQAATHVTAATQAREGDERFKESLLAVMFASLCLEAFVNEIAENIVQDVERDKFRKAERSMSVHEKVKHLFHKRLALALHSEQSPLKEVKDLFRVRNSLVHYRLHETAAKAYIPPLERRDFDDGSSMITIDFTKQPLRVEPSLVERINESEAAKAYNAALRIIKLWNATAGAPADTLANLSEL